MILSDFQIILNVFKIDHHNLKYNHLKYTMKLNILFFKIKYLFYNKFTIFYLKKNIYK